MAEIEKEIKITKSAEEEFEFFLKMNPDKKQVITKVTPGGPADRVGVHDGDVLLEVNGVDVSEATHEETVNIIMKSIPTNAVSFRIRRSTQKARPIENGKGKAGKPRICTLTKKEGSFGFNLKGFVSREKQAHIVELIKEGGAADEAGLLENDRIIKVNKTNVEKLTHQQLVAILKKVGNRVTLLVVDPATYHSYKSSKKKISEKDVAAAPSNGKSTKSSSKRHVTPGDGIAKDESESSAPRQLHIVPNNHGMGFFLRSKDQIAEEFAGGLEKDGAGYVCGLRENDRIIGVNGQSVHDKSHTDIISMLKANKHHVILVVLSPKSLRFIESKGIDAAGDMEVSKLDKPRVVKMDKGDDGYGFYLKMEQGDPHHILTDIEDGSVSERAGLKNNEILAAVNGLSVMHSSHKECVEKIKNSGDRVSLLVGSRDTMSVFYKLKIEVNDEFLDAWPKESAFARPIMSDFVQKRMASIRTYNESKKHSHAERDYRPRLCHLVKDAHSYCFYLRDDDGVHVLEQVERDGAAWRAGVLNNDVIIEVNGANVERESHDQVVERIREHKDSVTFLVADQATRDHFAAKKLAITAELVHAARETIEEKREEEAAASSDRHEESSSRALRPRFCHLVKDRTFGFHLNSEQNTARPGQFVRQVAEGGVADVAGIKEGDRIIEINKVNIEEKTHKEVVQMIVASGKEVDFLVVDEETDLHYKQIGVIVTMKLLRNRDDDEEKKSVSSSIHSVQAEATVHDVPEDKAEIVVEAIAERREEQQQDKEEDDMIAVQSIEAVIDHAEMKEEVKEEVKEEIKEELWEEVKEDIVAEVREDAVEELKEEIKEEIREEIMEEVAEAIVDKIEDAVEEAQEDREEEERRLRQEEEERRLRQEEEERRIREEEEERRLRQEEEERRIREEEEERLRKEQEEEETRRKMREEAEEELKRKMREEAEEEMRRKLREEAEEELKRKMREEAEEEMRRKIREEAEEEMRRKIREEMEAERERKMREQQREETQEEMMARLKEEVRKEMAQEAAPKIPEPPANPVLAAAVAKAEKSGTVRSRSSTTSSGSNSRAGADSRSSIDFSEIRNVKLNPVRGKQQKQPAADEDQQPAMRPVQSSIRDRLKMFESGKAARVKVNVAAAVVAQRQESNSSSGGGSRVTSPRSPPVAKPFTFKSASSMSFKIVETTPVIN